MLFGKASKRDREKQAARLEKERFARKRGESDVGGFRLGKKKQESSGPIKGYCKKCKKWQPISRLTCRKCGTHIGD